MSEKLNIVQKRAVYHKEGPMLLLAGPGSGKTFVITRRLKALIDAGINQESILVITFTKAAAIQMKERFIKLSNNENTKITFGTFHAVFYNILKFCLNGKQINPISEYDKYKYMSHTFKCLGMEDRANDKDELLYSLSLISSCKNNGNNPFNFNQERFSKEQFINIFKYYNDLLSEFNLIDFDDMINHCLNLLKNNSEICQMWQDKFKYILIDEFQDISLNQYELIKLLGLPENNIFAVGDDDQSIYSFRGAGPDIMKIFKNEYNELKQELLPTNYRCAKNIVKIGGILISDNKNRFSKIIESGRNFEGHVNIQSCKSINEQDELILNIIKQYIEAGDTYGDIAVLFRTNRFAKRFSTWLELSGIKSDYINKSVPLSSEFIKDMCAYMSIAYGDYKREHFIRIINKPLRYIKREALKNNMIKKNDILEYYNTNPKMKIIISELFYHFSRMHYMKPYLCLHYIRKTIGYDNFVKENNQYEKYQEYIDEISLFSELIKDCNNLEDVFNKLKEVQTRECTQVDISNNKVHIMTYHGSKGLEFKNVILPDVNEGIVPQKNANTDALIEEERRMLYVAMTRAKDNLTITYRTDDNRTVSAFLKNIIKECSYH